MVIQKIKSKRKPKNEYINNTEFYNKIVDHYNDIEIKLKNGQEIPKIPDYIGEAIMLIAENLMKSPNFYGYSYKEDMIADGIENCVRYFYKFDPSRSTSPFSYFTQVCYYAALRRIHAEKKQKDIKSEIIKNSGILDDIIINQQGADDCEYTNTYLAFLKEHIDTSGKETNNGTDSYKPLKKLTKLHQKRLKEKEEILKQLEQLTLEQISDRLDNFEDDDYQENEMVEEIEDSSNL